MSSEEATTTSGTTPTEIRCRQCGRLMAKISRHGLCGITAGCRRERNRLYKEEQKARAKGGSGGAKREAAVVEENVSSSLPDDLRELFDPAAEVKDIQLVPRLNVWNRPLKRSSCWLRSSGGGNR